ncbi:MAG: hypothetical protein ABL982_19465, partial [Vicinamibacterales bacterium]
AILPLTLPMLLPHDLILRRENGVFHLYEWNGTTAAEPLDGPWPSESLAISEAIARWINKGDIYIETGAGIYERVST